MQQMTKKERIRAMLRGLPVDRGPVAMWGHDPPREWSPADLVASTLESYREFDWDFIKLNPRASYFAEAWGSAYERPTAERGARVTSHAVRTVDDLGRLEAVDGRAGVFGEHLEALSMLVAEVGDEVDVIHTIFTPLGVLGALSGDPASLLEHATQDPAAVHVALSEITGTLCEYVDASLEAGASGIFLAPLRWASLDTCSESFYREHGRPYDLQVLARVREAEFNVLHVCQNHNMLRMLLDYPVHAFNWADAGIGNASLTEIRDEIEQAVIGGVDQIALPSMSPVEVRARVEGVLADGADRLCIGPGCSVPPETPAANRRAAIEAARGVGAR